MDIMINALIKREETKERILYISKEEDIIILININDNSWPQLNSYYEIKSELNIKKAEIIDDDNIRIISEDSINLIEKEKRDKAYSIVMYFYEICKEPLIYDTKIRNKYIKEVIRKYKVSRSTVELYLKRYWKRGMTKNSLIPDFYKSGGRGKEKTSGTKKRGKPSKYNKNGINIDENIKKICERVKVEDLEEVYLGVGNEKITPNSVINVIDKVQDAPVPKVVKMTTKSIDADIIVSGIDKVKVNLANCCNPVYGDEIVGYITKGNGITVHRLHCHNLSMLEERTLDVAWNSNVNKKYETCILIYTDTTDNHMMDLLQTISMFNINVDNIKTISKTDKTVYEVDCYVTGVEQLDKMTLAIKKNTFVEKVERAMR